MQSGCSGKGLKYFQDCHGTPGVQIILLTETAHRSLLLWNSLHRPLSFALTTNLACQAMHHSHYSILCKSEKKCFSCGKFF